MFTQAGQRDRLHKVAVESLDLRLQVELIARLQLGLKHLPDVVAGDNHAESDCAPRSSSQPSLVQPSLVQPSEARTLLVCRGAIFDHCK